MPPEPLAVYTAVYPAAERFLADWWRSIERQTDRDFDLWISLDGLSREQAIAAFGAEPNAVWLDHPAGSSVAQVRQQAIERMVERCDAVIFVDSDDILCPDRVAAARAALAGADAVACALQIIDEQGRAVGATFGLSDGADLHALMPRYNVFGLSNTAYRAALLRRLLPIAEPTALIDWLLATRAWASGARLKFDPAPRMLYRQYGANIARVVLPFSPPQVLGATQRVLEHYRVALTSAWRLPRPFHEQLENAQSRVSSFYRAITEAEATLNRYVDALNSLPPQYIWWWCVAHPELEKLWRN